MPVLVPKWGNFRNVVPEHIQITLNNHTEVYPSVRRACDKMSVAHTNCGYEILYSLPTMQSSLVWSWMQILKWWKSVSCPQGGSQSPSFTANCKISTYTTCYAGEEGQMEGRKRSWQAKRWIYGWIQNLLWVMVSWNWVWVVFQALALHTEIPEAKGNFFC